ncbi:MAG: hypothetical protein ACRC9K_02395 [Afipia sp.]
MLSSEELKSGLHSDLSQKDKLLLVLATFDEPCDVADLKKKASEFGLRMSTKWNPSARLGQAKGLAILTPRGWEITNAGMQHLKNIGFGSASPVSIHIASSLRSKLTEIKNPETKAFVEEAIKCYEAELHKSAVVMSWLAAVHVLYTHVYSNHLSVFNAEAARVDSKWKPAKSLDDLSRMKESEFLDRLVAISVIGKNVKTELKSCLDRRNACGHPNSLKIGASTVDHHLEILLLNVFQPLA